MGLKKILVHRSAVDRNHETGNSDPVFTVIDSEGGEHKSSSIIILGPCEIKYDREGGEGMRVWIETFDEVVLKNGTDAGKNRRIVATI